MMIKENEKYISEEIAEKSISLIDNLQEKKETKKKETKNKKVKKGA